MHIGRTRSKSPAGAGTTRRRRGDRRAFTAAELLVVVATIGVLTSVLVPTLSRGHQMGHRIGCQNNLRQLGLALLTYADDHENYLPPRSDEVRWPQRLLDYYLNMRVLRCPADVPEPATFGRDPNYPADCAPRSYIFNAWNDHFQEFLSAVEYERYLQGDHPLPVHEAVIVYTSETIVFGEKKGDGPAHGCFYLDLLSDRGNPIQEVEQARHGGAGPESESGGSNYAFADGSVRFLRFGATLSPENLWAVTTTVRRRDF